MNNFITKYRQAIIFTVFFFMVFGLFSWMNMPRQEDPTILDRYGNLVILWPGASPKVLEQQVAAPVYSALKEVEDLVSIQTSVRQGVVYFSFEQYESNTDIDGAWRKINEAIAKAKKKLPPSVASVNLLRGLTDVTSVVVSLTGSDDVLFLEDAALKLRDSLLQIETVKKVQIKGSPEGEVVIEVSDSVMQKYGIYPEVLAPQIQKRNAMISPGSIRTGIKSVMLNTSGSLETIKELENIQITLPSGRYVLLKDIAKVSRKAKSPVASRVYADGQEAILLGIVPKSGINVVEFGESLRKFVKEEKSSYMPLKLKIVNFQPGFVKERLENLSLSLILGTVLIAIIICLSLGIRMAFIVSFSVPCVAFITIGLYHLLGGVLQQMSVAGLVIAIGIFVDNVIVVSELIQKKIDTGMSRLESAVSAVEEISSPLAISTGTTIAAFLPLYLASGVTAEFISAIPEVVILSLMVSLCYALIFVPVICILIMRESTNSSAIKALLDNELLKGSSEDLEENSLMFDKIFSIIKGITKRKVVALSIVALFVGGSLYLNSKVERSFFPESDRSQLLLDIRLSQGTHIETTDYYLKNLLEIIAKNHRVRSTVSSAGVALPKFYYNLSSFPYNGSRAQILINLNHKSEIPRFMSWFNSKIVPLFPSATLTLSKLAQGPYVVAPIDIRVFSENKESLREAAKELTGFLSKDSETVAVRHTLDNGMPRLNFGINDYLAEQYKIGRSSITQALLMRTYGLPVSTFYGTREPSPIKIRSPEGENYSSDNLRNIPLANREGKTISINHISDVKVEWKSSAVDKLNGRSLIYVRSDLKKGANYNNIVKRLKVALKDGSIDLPNDVELEIEGLAKESEKSDTSLSKSLPIGLFLLIFFVLLEFNSLRKLLLILMTIPLSITGVLPGLVITNSPMGFMAMLGCLSLVGIVVNNAIILMDSIREKEEKYIADYESLRDLVMASVKLRVRPVILTTATTILGLLPLSLGGSSLWPPLANALIFGLAGSTIFTLILIPTAYEMLFKKKFNELKRGQ